MSFKTYKHFFIALCFWVNTVYLYSQATVTQIFSDFGGWWTSSTTGISPTAPNNSHNLLGFRVGSTVYSTGVNDLSLTAYGISFIPQLFESFPIISVGSGGIIGVGGSYSATVVNNPVLYLTDGTRGLDMGTAMFNWSGTNRYTVTAFNVSAIGDGIPDILIPQMGDPSAGSTDIFRFENSSNALVGTQVSVNFSSVSSVGNSNWKFYSRATPPVVGAASAGNRAIRMVAYDFADLGITAANYTNVTSFVHQLSGSSDQCFVAYNKTSFTILPITLLSFDAVAANKQVQLSWSTASEQNNNFFTLERSKDALYFAEVGKVNSKAMNGNSYTLLEYTFADNQPLEGYSYYRLKQTDFNGNYTYSYLRSVNTDDMVYDFKIYPNPADEIVYVELSSEGNVRWSISILNCIGETVYSSSLEGSMARIHVSDLGNGIYFVKTESDGKTAVKKLIVEKK